MCENVCMVLCMHVYIQNSMESLWNVYGKFYGKSMEISEFSIELHGNSMDFLDFSIEMYGNYIEFSGISTDVMVILWKFLRIFHIVFQSFSIK